MPVAIKIENISKQYRLGQVGTGTISHDLNRWWANMRGKEDPYSQVGQVNQRDQVAESDYVWALKDIDFEVEQGEVLGIIGANGAGKSTLLKIISRITSPTTGSIKAKGRIASLLEVGTGMHPEMTARENIYLNGAIMGMKRREITKKFDDIIDFAGCKMYVDTPVKRFSSGMKVRLGFAVAAFLEPEILIIDEVLAVGDIEFQSRCLEKIGDVASHGRTVLFVSHNLASVETLCSKCVILSNGSMSLGMPAKEAVSVYINSNYCLLPKEHHLFDSYLRSIEITDLNNDDLTEIRLGASLEIKLILDLPSDWNNLIVGIALDDSRGQRMLSLNSGGRFTDIKKGSIICICPSSPLPPGIYHATVVLHGDKGKIERFKNIAEFTVIDKDIYGHGRGFHKGICYSPVDWSAHNVLS